MIKRESDIGKKLILAAFVCLAAAALTGALGAALPRVQAASEPPTATANEPKGKEIVSPAESSQQEGRDGGVYTIVLAGLDDVSGNTDTLFVGRVDSQRRTIDLVSIPRDTYVNLPWAVRKINCVYTGTKNSGGDGLEGLRGAVCSLTGFMPDCCVVVDTSTVISAIDIMGGVYFDVPFDMDYEDPEQDLSIHISTGYQLLNGQQCLQLCRYRKDYVNGDLDRISLQHSFLRSAAKQFITLGSVPELIKVAQLVASHTDSDLSAANVAFFLRCALQCRAEDIHIATMPNTPAEIDSLSYTFVDLEEWVAMLNEMLNPFDTPLSQENLDAVYIRDGVLRRTRG